MSLKSNDKPLIIVLNDLNESLFHVEYLLANPTISFIDDSTLRPLKRTLSKSITSISKLVDPKLLDVIEPSELICSKCNSQYSMKYADFENWEHCPRCGETFL